MAFYLLQDIIQLLFFKSCHRWKVLYFLNLSHTQDLTEKQLLYVLWNESKYIEKILRCYIKTYIKKCTFKKCRVKVWKTRLPLKVEVFSSAADFTLLFDILYIH